MKEGLLEKIRNFGHWRVNIRPLTPLGARLTLQRCEEIVGQSRVSIRGWDYPHFSHRHDDQGGSERGGEYFENWCDWNSQVEFWRMYRSGQFLSYNALNDDTENAYNDNIRRLNIVDAIYTISEFTEFASRLSNNAGFVPGCHISITLNGSSGRRLEAGRNRVPFFEARSTNAENIVIERELIKADDSQAVAVDILVELFDHFGWNPDVSQIRNDQRRFYNRDFSA